MRPIDADALKQTISKYEFTAPNKTYQHGGECVLNFYMPKIIDDAPTIEAEPVRHGEWTEKKSGKGVFDYYFICSECHKNTPDKAFLIAPDFCPNCGAKMDGGANIP